MIVAKAKISSRNSSKYTAKTAGFSESRLSKAFVVLKYRTDLADLVISGAMPLDDAYDKAIESKQASLSEQAKMRRLQKNAPDLFDQVTDSRLSLLDTIGALDAREAQAKIERDRQRELNRARTQSLASVVISLTPGEETASVHAKALIETIDFEFLGAQTFR
jgi:hypothetical protein